MMRTATRGMGPALACAALMLAGLAASPADAGAAIGFGNLQMGVNDLADLNVATNQASANLCSPASACSASSPCTPAIGAPGPALLAACDNALGFRWNGLESVADNCRCEGWGGPRTGARRQDFSMATPNPAWPFLHRG